MAISVLFRTRWNSRKTPIAGRRSNISHMSGNQLFKIGSREVGTRAHRRWVLHNSLTPEQFWNGKQWTESQYKTLLFLDRNQSYHTAKVLQDEILKDVPVRTYTASMTIEVRSHAPYRLEELKDYLHGASSFELDFDLYGTDPSHQSHVSAVIHWGALSQEVK